MCRSQKSIFTQTNGVGTSVQNLKGKRSTVAKMCCLVQRAIFIVIKSVITPCTSPILLDTVPYIYIYIIIYIIIIIYYIYISALLCPLHFFIERMVIQFLTWARSSGRFNLRVGKKALPNGPSHLATF